MIPSRLLAVLAAGCCLATEAAAQPYTFNVDYFGGDNASLAAGSDDPLATTILAGDSFLWTIRATGGAYWNVDTGGGFFPLMAFGVQETGTRTGDYTLTLFRNGVSAFTFSEIGSVQNYVHLGTNSISLVTGFEFDLMQLTYALTDAAANDPNDPQPGGAPIGSTPRGLLPIFGAPQENPFSPGISYVTTSTPEPATITLVLSGLGLLGVAVRRRRTPE